MDNVTSSYNNTCRGYCNVNHLVTCSAINHLVTISTFVLVTSGYHIHIQKIKVTSPSASATKDIQEPTITDDQPKVYVTSTNEAAPLVADGDFDDTASQASQSSQSSQSRGHSVHGRRSFDHPDAEIIQRICKTIIEGNTMPIRKAQISELITSDIEGNLMLVRLNEVFGKETWKKIVDRVRTFRKQYLKDIE